MFFEAVDLYRTGVLNLFKHVAQQRVRGPPTVQLLQRANCRPCTKHQI